MDDLRELVHRSLPASRPASALFVRLTRAGIVTDDPDVARRQVFTNAAAFAVVLSALSHLIIGVLHNFHGLMPLHIYNLVVIIVALSLHKLHRYGENLVAICLCTLIVAGHSFVVFALGYDSDLQIYFLLVGFLFFLFGVRHWRIYLFFYLAAFVMLIVTVKFGMPTGFVIPQDLMFRRFLQSQALANAMIINGLGVSYVLASLNRAERDLAQQVSVANALVDVMLPRAISARLKGGRQHIADHVESATVMFADLSGFTPAAAAVTAAELVDYLDRLFSGFDVLCRAHGVDKIKTIGDSYMAAGLSGAARDNAIAVGRLALALLDFTRDHSPLGAVALPLRVGLHSGPVVAGVIGDLRVSYDIWGDTVNVAQRMEANGKAGRVQVTSAFKELAGDNFTYEDRGIVSIKGLGRTRTWFLQ